MSNLNDASSDEKESTYDNKGLQSADEDHLNRLLEKLLENYDSNSDARLNNVYKLNREEFAPASIDAIEQPYSPHMAFSPNTYSNNYPSKYRSKRRISVFKNVYHQCRIQKRKERNLCLYLANLYQNLKGFHGL